MVNPSETPQKPGKSLRLLRLETASQQGEPGYGSGDPYVTKAEHVDMSVVTVTQSTLAEVLDFETTQKTNITSNQPPVTAFKPPIFGTF
ncbi:hypothetical protein E3N88_38885 [Mikania micrantha]|uniref:Uncharacterized protein n=1 Tax=Mikania micrantha TaxID=192012 RepID=A0A5N6LV90_9ASTR|nr:hypothetical protein E3N88_38885 [Mikania micrantha]